MPFLPLRNVTSATSRLSPANVPQWDTSIQGQETFACVAHALVTNFYKSALLLGGKSRTKTVWSLALSRNGFAHTTRCPNKITIQLRQGCLIIQKGRMEQSHLFSYTGNILSPAVKTQIFAVNEDDKQVGKRGREEIRHQRHTFGASMPIFGAVKCCGESSKN